MSDNFSFVDLRKSGYYDIAFGTNIGRRDIQQDAGYVAACDNEILAVICDGMGGMAGGELASRTAIERFLEEYEEAAQIESPNWMENAVDKADTAVFALEAADRSRLGAGTTMVAIHIMRDDMSWVSVGDSRLYIIRAQQLAQVTTDHNYFLQLDDLIEKGAISREQYRMEATDGEALISYIGMGGVQWKDINTEAFRLLPGDTLLLCTDGLYRSVSDSSLLSLITASDDMGSAANRLEEAIQELAEPEQDNYTYVLIHLNGGKVK